MTTAEAAKLELAKRELARRNFKFFVQMKFERFNKIPFLDNWHQDYICEALSCTLPSYCKAKKQPLIRRLMLNMPPSYGKTELIARCFIPFALGLNPARKFIYISYSDDLCRKINNQIRAVIKSQFYSAIFGAQNFLFENSTEFELRQGGGLFVTTLKKAITGFHAHQILIDDPIKVSDMASRAERERVCENFTTSILTRLQDAESNITILMQRLGDEDLCGFLLNPKNFSAELIDQWKHLNLEALNEKAKIYEIGGFRYERAAGEPLFPARHSVADLEEQKAIMGTDDFSTQYQQDPQVTFAGYFEPENLKVIPSYEIGETADYIFVDNALSPEMKSDNRAVVVIGVERRESGLNRYIVKDVFFGIWDEETTAETIVDVMSKYPAAKCYIESEAGGYNLSRLVDKKIIEANEKLKKRGAALITNSNDVYKPSHKISKAEKIKLMRPYVNSGNLVLSKTANGTEQFKKELFSFNPEKPFRKDDTIDCVASCIAAEFVNGSETPPRYMQERYSGGGGWNL